MSASTNPYDPDNYPDDPIEEYLEELIWLEDNNPF